MAKETLTVKWTMDDGIIKFEERDIIYDLSDKVKTFIEKNPVADGAKVEVDIDPDEGENEGTVNRLVVLKEDAKKAEVPTETKTEEKSADDPTEVEAKVLNLSGISVKQRGAIFKDIPDVWFTLVDSLDVDDVKANCQGKTVRVEIEKTEDGQNDLIHSISVVEAPKESKQEQPKASGNGGYSTQCSIEAQVALNRAVDVMIALISKDKEIDPKSFIKELALENFQTMQEMRTEKEA